MCTSSLFAVSGSFAVVIGAGPSDGKAIWLRVCRDGESGQSASPRSCVVQVDIAANFVDSRKMWKERRERPIGIDGPIQPWLAL